jgi:radical SAM superfamily enzyme YgiQ (UPF0313 family)
MSDRGTVILFHPSLRVGREVQNRVSIPLGLIALATPLDLAGYRVKIIDQAVDRNWKDILISELRAKPICVGVSTKTGPQIRYALEASKIVKQYNNIPVVWGGVHPSLLPEQTLENEYIDIVVQGEGEETFFELVQVLEKDEALSTVKGIWYKENSEIKNTGCPYKCSFCYNPVFNKRTWRALTTEKTLEEIKKVRDKYSIRGFQLTDDLFFKDIERVKKILTEIVDNKLDIVFTKLDIHGSKLSGIDDDLLKLVERAGCKMLVVGVESGSQKILKMLNKGINISQLIDFNRRIKRFSIVPKYTFMLGFPTEEKDDIQKTISLIFRLLEDNKEAMKDIFIYTPYPGTELFDLSVKNGLKPPERLEDWVSFNWRTINMRNTPWVTGDREKLLRMLHCSSLFLEKNYFLNPIWPTNPLIVMLAKLYHPIAKKRVKNFYYKFPIEIKLAEWLRLYQRQV